MDTAAVLAAFDEQLRRNPRAGPADHVESGAQVTRVISDGDSWSGVIWSDLTETDADAALAREPDSPAGVDLVPVTGQEKADALRGLGLLPAAVAVIAMAGDTPVAAERVEFPAGSDFASIWGGGTLPAWHGRGIFRSLVAYRAALAHRRGYRYLHVDASPGSRPSSSGWASRNWPRRHRTGIPLTSRPVSVEELWGAVRTRSRRQRDRGQRGWSTRYRPRRAHTCP